MFKDIDEALRAVEGAASPGIHIFIATSDLHLEHKLGMTRSEVVDAAVVVTDEVAAVVEKEAVAVDVDAEEGESILSTRRHFPR